jgi:hypothetical protein
LLGGERIGMPTVLALFESPRRFLSTRASECWPDACDYSQHSEERTFMTHTAQNPLYRYVAVAFVALAMTVSALPAQAQRYGHGGYHGRPAPRYDNRGYRGRGGSNGGAIVAGALLGVIAGTVIANSAQRPPPDVVYSSPPPPPPPGVVYYNNGYPPPPNGY